jgi:hypothetical protein
MRGRTGNGWAGRQLRMPPWFADAKHGNFANDRRMSQQEIDTLVAWAETGVKEALLI